jgi:hypothetical protein
MKKLFLLTALLTAIILGLAFKVYAAPNLINYEGRLTDSSGSPLTGTYNLRFSITADLAGSTTVWGPEANNNVTVANGVFAVVLGETTPITTAEFSSDVRYLKLEIANPPTSTTNYETLTPLTQVVSVAYALKAAAADNVSGGYVSRIIPGTNITIAPVSGTGAVTINAAGGGGGHLTI